MAQEMTIQGLTEILHRITVIYAETDDMDKRLGYPFSRLSREKTHIAQAILEGGALGQAPLDTTGSMLLIWRRVGVGLNDRWHFELSHLNNLYSRTIAQVHEYFQKEKLMAREGMLFE